MHHGYEKNHAEVEFLFSGKEAIRKKKKSTTSMTQEFTSKPTIYVASFPGPAQLSVTCRTESWAGSGNEATIYANKFSFIFTDFIKKKNGSGLTNN